MNNENTSGQKDEKTKGQMHERAKATKKIENERSFQLMKFLIIIRESSGAYF
jgi:hypothetical protein